MGVKDRSEPIVLTGIDASPGIAIGEAYLVRSRALVVPVYEIGAESVESEIARFRGAVERSKEQILRVKDQLAGPEAISHIFDAHLMILDDVVVLEEISRNILLTTVDAVINWARRASPWPAICFPACCAFEYIAANASRFDLPRFGMDVMRASPRHADLMITAGTLTWKMAPQVRRIYDQMAEPKWVMAFGACTCSGGPYNNYATVQGIDTIIPVDIYIPGCPPRPEAVFDGLIKLQRMVQASPGWNRPRHRETADLELPVIEKAVP